MSRTLNSGKDGAMYFLTGGAALIRSGIVCLFRTDSAADNESSLPRTAAEARNCVTNSRNFTGAGLGKHRVRLADLNHSIVDPLRRAHRHREPALSPNERRALNENQGRRRMTALLPCAVWGPKRPGGPSQSAGKFPLDTLNEEQKLESFASSK